MSQSNAGGPGSLQEAKLPRRDWVLLPLLGLLTVCLVVAANQLTIWWMFPYSKAVGEDCLRLHVPLAGARGIPHCVCYEEVPEGVLTEYRFNSSGYRDDVEFGPKPPGTYRIVMVGTSTPAGFRVPQEQSLAELLPVELSRQSGRKVELYNESLPGRTQHNIVLLFGEFRTDNPDMILWVLTPIDLEGTLPAVSTTDEARPLSLSARAWRRIKAAIAIKPLVASISKILGNPHSSLLLRHFLYQSPSLYVKASLIAPDDESGFLKSEPSGQWQQGLNEFDSIAADLEGQARASGIPVVAVLVPNRAQAAMISMGEWPVGYDPYKLNEELRSIITSHGGTYIDLFPDFRNILNPEQGYFPVDGHLNADGHAMIARLIAKQLTSRVVPALKAAH